MVFTALFNSGVHAPVGEDIGVINKEDTAARALAEHPPVLSLDQAARCPVLTNQRGFDAHPALRDVVGHGKSFPANNGVVTAQGEQASQVNGLSRQLVNLFWRTLGWNAASASLDYVPLQFASPESWPVAAPHSSEREKAVLAALVGFIEKHAPGIYTNVLEKFHQSGHGVTESQGMLDPALRSYAGKPEGMVAELLQFLNTLSLPEYLLVYSALASIDKKTLLDQKIFDRQPNFSPADALEKSQPVINYYLSKIQAPTKHKVPGENYDSYPEFMQVKTLRPNTKHLPVAVTEQIVYHAVCAVSLNIVKLYKFTDVHDRMDKKFEREKLEHRLEVWDLSRSVSSLPDLSQSQESDFGQASQLSRSSASFSSLGSLGNSFSSFSSLGSLLKTAGAGIASDSQEVFPRYMPELSETSFESLDLPDNVPVFPVLYATPDLEGKASAVVHPDTGRCLVELVDYTLEPAALRYMVAEGRPPMSKYDAEAPFEMLDSAAKALEKWSGDSAQ